MEIDGSLSIEPEVGGCSECCTEFERHFGRHRRSCVHDAIDNLDITSNVVRKLFLRHVERFEKLLPQNLARSGWFSLSVHVRILQRPAQLVVVDDIDVFRSLIGPAKNQAPLIVHSDAVKPAPASF
jgi:hypothetical protein